MRKLKKYILIFVFVLFAVTSVFLTIESVATGSEISSLEITKESLLSTQRDLKESLAKGISIASLEAKRTELGFVPALELVYINENEGVAAR